MINNDCKVNCNPESNLIVTTCIRCGDAKPISEFGIRKDKASGRSSTCKPCRNRRAIQTKYNISKNEINTLLTAQMGHCWICGLTAAAFAQGLVIDHCHKTGKIRGALCPKCNMGIGQFDEMPNRFEKAIKYLERFK